MDYELEQFETSVSYLKQGSFCSSASVVPAVSRLDRVRHQPYLSRRPIQQRLSSGRRRLEEQSGHRNWRRRRDRLGRVSGYGSRGVGVAIADVTGSRPEALARDISAAGGNALGVEVDVTSEAPASFWADSTSTVASPYPARCS